MRGEMAAQGMLLTCSHMPPAGLQVPGALGAFSVCVHGGMHQRSPSMKALNGHPRQKYHDRYPTATGWLPSSGGVPMSARSCSALVAKIGQESCLDCRSSSPSCMVSFAVPMRSRLSTMVSCHILHSAYCADQPMPASAIHRARLLLTPRRKGAPTQLAGKTVWEN